MRRPSVARVWPRSMRYSIVRALPAPTPTRLGANTAGSRWAVLAFPVRGNLPCARLYAISVTARECRPRQRVRPRPAVTPAQGAACKLRMHGRSGQPSADSLYRPLLSWVLDDRRRLMLPSRLQWTPASLVAAALLFGAIAAIAQGDGRGVPPDTSAITEGMIAEGRAIYRGHGGCLVCHGAKLEGGVGPTLLAHRWKDAERGEYAAIIRVLSRGVPNTVMVARPNGISNAQVVAVAAYVWAVNHGRASP